MQYDTHVPVPSSPVTVVTAFLNLGSFEKGSKKSIFTPQLYKKWMKVFQQIENPLVVYVERQEDVEYFTQLRRDRCRTHIVLVNRNDTWAFSLQLNISKIYHDPNYPKYYPNTFYPEYSCTMHAKYEFMKHASNLNMFGTNYFAWVDIGYFRQMISTTNITQFILVPPPQFDEGKVSYNAIGSRKANLSPETIFKSNKVWVGGGFFLTTRDLMMNWTALYQTNVEYFLRKGLMNTDQQVIYAMVNSGRSTIPIQTFEKDRRRKGSFWFYLGYQCMSTTSIAQLDNHSDTCMVQLSRF